MKKLILTLTLILLATTAQAKHLHKESWYVDKYCKGYKEVTLPNGWRVDCIQDDYAIQYDFAIKRDEALGQALRYANATNLDPAIVLIIVNDSDYRYVEEVKNTIKYHGLKVKVETVGGRDD